MKWSHAVVLLAASSFPAFAAGRPACAPYIPAYNQAVENGQAIEALHDLFGELGVSATEEARIGLEPGLRRQNDDRLADADPTTQEIRVDPELLLEGPSGACQDLAHELEHLRHFARDRAALRLWGQSTMNAWEGCDDVAPKATADERMEQAYECLEDNALTTHSAAYEIEGVLAQVAVAQERLRAEDYDYLVEHMQRFDAARALLLTHKNEGYYPPTVKNEDERVYCAGAAYLSAHGGWKSGGCSRD